MSISSAVATSRQTTERLIEVQMFERVDHPRDVVQILRGRVPVLPGLGIDDVYRRSSGAEVHARTPRLHVVLWVLSMQHEVPRRPRHRVLDQRARENQPTRGGERRARLGHILDAARGRVSETNVFEHVERAWWMRSTSASASGL